MKKKEHFTADYTKHYVLQEIGMIKGYKLVNETTETAGLITEDCRDKDHDKQNGSNRLKSQKEAAV